MTMKDILITAALPYANGNIHIGHISGCYLNADIRSRFERLNNNNVLFVSGSDAYGVAIMITAQTSGMSNIEVVNKFHSNNKKLLEELDISFDIFSSTLCDEHKDTVINFFDSLYKNGFIEEKTSDQLFDPINKEFLADRFIVGTCPKCGSKDARGDECSRCSSILDSIELIDPKSKIHGNKLEIRGAKHFYLKLSKCKDILNKFIESRSFRESDIPFMKDYINSLEDRCISRSIDWGIKIPDKYKTENSDANVFYVWFDAPIGYISISKEWAKQTGNKDEWKRFWKNKFCKVVNFMGKDNIVFHSIMFPAMEIAAYNYEYNVVDEICSNNFLLLNNKKFSKGDGNYIDTSELIKEFGVDALRFYLASNAPETSDASFSVVDMKHEINTVLIGKIGNFINRSLVFHCKFIGDYISSNLIDEEFYNYIIRESEEVKKYFSLSYVRKAISKIREMSEYMNRYFDTSKPWTLKNDESKKPEMETILNTCIFGIKTLALLLHPVVPNISNKILGMLNIKEIGIWDDFITVKPSKGDKINQPETIINRLE